MMVLEKISAVIDDMPGIHGSGTYRIADRDLKIIEQYVRKDSVTAETGAGLSTIFFAIIGCRHTAIAPSREEWVRIQEACRRHNISPQNITFLDESSVDALPRLPIGSFDFCFIDGCHGFPVACMDFYYMSRMLKIGGILGIDDVPIWACKIVVDFLHREEGWKYLVTGDKSAFFSKHLEDQESREWDSQPYNAKMTKKNLRGTSFLKAFALIPQRSHKLIRLISEGDYGAISKRLKRLLNR